MTGATGLLESHLVHRPVDRGDEVVTLVPSLEKAAILPDRAEVVRGDLTEKASTREPTSDVDGVPRRRL